MSVADPPPPPPDPNDASRRRRTVLALAGVLAVTLLVFLRALRGELVYDDLLVVERNPRLRDLSWIPTFFSRPYWDFLGASDPIGVWRPLTATLMSLAHVVGDGSPAALHAASLQAHLLATAAAFLVARRFLEVGGAAGCALVFGLHPLQVEPVAWITSLADPLSCAFLLLSVNAWIGWRQRGSRGLPWAAAAWFVPALLAKEAAVATIAVVLVVDLARGLLARPQAADPDQGRPTTSHASAYGCLGAVLALYVVARVLVFRSPWAGFLLPTTGFGVDEVRMALLRVELLGGSLELLAWPWELNPFRAFRPTLAATDASLLRAGAWILAWGVLVAWLWGRRTRAGLVAALVVPAALLPILVRPEALGFFPLSDRFLYVAVLGPALAVGLGIDRLSRARAWTALALVTLVLGALSFRQIGTWRDEQTLFRRAAALSPRSPHVQWWLGRVLLSRYRESGDALELSQAKAAYERAQDLLIESREADSDVFASSRDFLQTNLGYGWCQLLEDERRGYAGSNVALSLFEKLAEELEAVRQRTREARALGIRVQDEGLEVEQVHTAIGVAHMGLGAVDRAEEALRRALTENPRYVEAHRNLGRLYGRQGEWALARRHFERALEALPDDYETRLLIAQALQSEGRSEAADELAAELVAQDDSRPPPYLVRAAAALQLGRPDDALEHLERALALDAELGQAWLLRAQALLLRQSIEPALRAYRRATELLPGSFDAHHDFGIVLVNTGQLEAGLKVLTRAYELAPEGELRERLRGALLDLPLPSADQAFLLASIDGQRGELTPAMAWLERALELDPEHADSLFQRGRILRETGRHAEALELMMRASPLEATSFRAHVELAGYLLELGRPEEALARYERAAALGPPDDWPREMADGARDEVTTRIAELRGR